MQVLLSERERERERERRGDAGERECGVDELLSSNIAVEA